MAQTAEMPSYQHEDAWNVDWLRVDDVHELHYQQYGKKDGKPVIYLHGGPGGNCSKGNTVFFDPSEYRVILLDQRGCGQSRPNATTTNNTTWHLVADIEALRKHLSIAKWHMVFGGSWGSTLALAYAQTHPESVGSLVLRGIFTVRDLELKWTNLRGGASFLFPDRFDEFLNFLPEEERSDHITNYHKRLMSSDTAISHPAATAWNTWEISISTLYPDPKAFQKLQEPAYLLAHARIEIHYFTNKAWMEDGQLLKKENVDRIRHIPTTIVQGRYDIVCPPITAWELHKQWPESKLHFVDDAGHSVMEPGTRKRLTEVCNDYLSAASFPFDIAEGPPPNPLPSSDITLNALVQHGVLKLDCDRAFLSLIDNRNQYICAEMTKDQPLMAPDPTYPLLLGTSRIALEWGVCPYTMSVFHGRPVVMPESPYIIADKTYFCIKDFRQVPNFAARPYVAGYPSMVSYLEIPLLSASGYILGSYCVVDNKERDFMQPTALGALREVTSAISSYLDMKRAEASKSRSERMMDGLRQFVGSDRPSAVSNVGRVGIKPPQATPFEPNILRAASRRDPGSQATDATASATATNVTESNKPSSPAAPPVEHLHSISISNAPAESMPQQDPTRPNSEDGPSRATSPMQRSCSDFTKPDMSSQIDDLFSRAASKIGYAMDLDGLVFFDAISTGVQRRNGQVPFAFADDGSSHTEDLLAIPLARYRADNAADEQSAGQLVWVSGTGKTLDTGDVNSLAAFGNSLMSQVFSIEATLNTQSKSDFVSSISHELRSPLHGILASIELIQENAQGSELPPELSMIESCASTLLDTFDHLLEYSKVNSRSGTAQQSEQNASRPTLVGTMNVVTADLAMMIEEVLETVSTGHAHSLRLFSGLNKERQDTLNGQSRLTLLEPVIMTTHTEKDRNWTVAIDRGAWKRIVLNIISNSLKYTKSGHIDVRLSLLEATDGGTPQISFSVLDTGIGMSEEFLKYHIFTPFTQENVLSPGTGLGLSLVKAMVAALQGKVLVDSRLGEGTRVTVNIPYNQGPRKPTNLSAGAGTASQDRLQTKTLGLIGLFPPNEAGSKTIPYVAALPTVLEDSIRNLCQDHFGMDVVDISTGMPPTLDMILVDAHTLSRTYTYDWKELLPGCPSEALTHPVVVLGSPNKDEAQKIGGMRATHVISPVTKKRLCSALITALDNSASTEIQLASPPPPPTPTSHQNSVEPEPEASAPTSWNELAAETSSKNQETNLPTRHPPPKESPPPETPSNTQAPPCRFRRFLLVDDNLINLKMLCAFAKRFKVPYSSATDGAEAVRLYETAARENNGQDGYDCIFMDISMPVMDGFEAVNSIRRVEDDVLKLRAEEVQDGSVQEKKAERVYIFALTGLGSDKARKEAERSGFDEFLLKPVRFKDVLPLVAPLVT
ncbi:prolyl aminopeptidase [Stemphylium lycopersici]|nr:prolyl aminopeptidase [Stemphylium lycopersici]